MKVLSKLTETDTDFTFSLAIRFSKSQYEWLKKVAYEEESDLELLKDWEQNGQEVQARLAFLRGLVSYTDMWYDRDKPEVQKILTEMAMRKSIRQQQTRKRRKKRK